MTQSEKYKYALQLLKELNCPKPIMEALDIWGMFVGDDEIKLHNWQALSDGGIIEGVGREITCEPNDRKERNEKDTKGNLSSASQ